MARHCKEDLCEAGRYDDAVEIECNNRLVGEVCAKQKGVRCFLRGKSKSRTRLALSLGEVDSRGSGELSIREAYERVLESGRDREKQKKPRGFIAGEFLYASGV